MPGRDIATKELAQLLSVLSHPHRIRIIEELRSGERDVNALAKILSTRQSTVSQHLAQLRAHRLVKTRREGRHVYYRLASPAIARWLIDGLQFIEAELLFQEDIHSAVEQARRVWPGEHTSST